MSRARNRPLPGFLLHYTGVAPVIIGRAGVSLIVSSRVLFCSGEIGRVRHGREGKGTGGGRGKEG